MQNYNYSSKSQTATTISISADYAQTTPQITTYYKSAYDSYMEQQDCPVPYIQNQRKEGDSNPRNPHGVQQFSRLPRSTTPASFQKGMQI